MAPSKKASGGETARSRPRSWIFKLLSYFSSVRFGIYLLIALVILSLAGMVIVQQNTEGFPAFVAGLAAWQRTLLEWTGLFDVYHSWYYRLLIAALSLNIILASIERFPSTWKLVREPNVTLPPARFEASPHFRDFLFDEGDTESAGERAAEVLRSRGFRDIRQEVAGTVRFVFAQKGSWNRFGAYAVHISLLLILFGGFLTSWSARSGEMALSPGDESDQIVRSEVLGELRRKSTTKLPFKVVCRDFRQKLIDPNGPLRPSNTLDWITELTIIDGDNSTDVTVSLNQPVDYGGYRIFHSSSVPLGRARKLDLSASSEGKPVQRISLDRGGSAQLSDGTLVKFVEFRARFDMKSEDPTADTMDYESPAAVLEVTPPGRGPEPAFAFGELLAGSELASRPVAGYTFRIDGFEKVADKHILYFRRDPGQPFLYSGFAILAITLLAVFLSSHHRYWFRADSEGDGIRVRIAGETNRPYDSFDSSFEKTTTEISEALKSAD